MEATITIKEMLEFMDSARPFDITYVTADRRKGTGGQLVSVTRARKTGTMAKDGQKLTASVIKAASRLPNHSEHFTRNIVLKDRTVKKIHPDLVTRFNGRKVI